MTISNVSLVLGRSLTDGNHGHIEKSRYIDLNFINEWYGEWTKLHSWSNIFYKYSCWWVALDIKDLLELRLSSCNLKDTVLKYVYYIFNNFVKIII